VVIPSFIIPELIKNANFMKISFPSEIKKKKKKEKKKKKKEKKKNKHCFSM